MTAAKHEGDGRATILLVEDDRELRNVGVRVLTKAGFNVLAAEDAIEAAGVLTQEHVDLLVADILLPGLSGTELAREVRQQYPDVRILFVSGSHHEPALDSIDLVESAVFLPKPYTPDQLIAAVRKSLA